jgi:hypothetical protein
MIKVNICIIDAEIKNITHIQTSANQRRRIYQLET